jgi:hypothetical protein
MAYDIPYYVWAPAIIIMGLTAFNNETILGGYWVGASFWAIILTILERY